MSKKVTKKSVAKKSATPKAETTKTTAAKPAVKSKKKAATPAPAVAKKDVKDASKVVTNFSLDGRQPKELDKADWAYLATLPTLKDVREVTGFYAPTIKNYIKKHNIKVSWKPGRPRVATPEA